MIWTLVLFGFTMWVLSKVAFPRIQEALDKRANAIRESIEAAERQRQEADQLLDEYRERLKEAREQAEDIVARARKAAEAATAEAVAEGKEKREELVAAARRDIETETRRSLERIRKEVADLTVLATEKVTRKALDSEDHKRLIEEALAEVDFSALAGNGKAASERAELMEEIARVYAEALFEVAQEKGKLDAIHEQLGQFADALPRTATCRSSSSAPTSPRPRSARDLQRAISGAEPELVNFLELLAEKHRMPVDLPHPRPVRRAVGRGEQAARGEADQRGRARPEVVERVGAEIERQTDRKIELESERRRGHPRRPRAAGRQHGPGREPAQQAGETEKGSRPGGCEG